MILEVNAQPGLKIQIANRAGLWERLNRVQGLKVVSPRHGIRVAQALFADPKLQEKGLGRKTVGAYEEVEVHGLNGNKLTMAWRMVSSTSVKYSRSTIGKWLMD